MLLRSVSLQPKEDLNSGHREKQRVKVTDGLRAEVRGLLCNPDCGQDLAVQKHFRK